MYTSYTLYIIRSIFTAGPLGRCSGQQQLQGQITGKISGDNYSAISTLFSLL